MDGAGNLVGGGDIAAQTLQVLRNIEACLAAVDATPEHLINWQIQLKQGEDLQAAFMAGMQWWGQRPNPPLNNVFFVPSLVPAEFLITIAAIAVVPLPKGAS